MESPAPPSPTSSPSRKSKFDMVHNNKVLASERKETLESTVFGLKFSGYAFLALAVGQTAQMTFPACLDSFAYGIFLLDAARRVNKLVKNEARKSAQDQLVDALDSVAQCHAIFAWVTIMSAMGLFAEVTGLKAAGLKWAEDNDAVNPVLGWNEYYFFSFKALVAACGAAGLKFGGYDYMVGKAKYWTKASKIGRELVTHKFAKVFSKKDNGMPPLKEE